MIHLITCDNDESGLHCNASLQMTLRNAESALYSQSFALTFELTSNLNLLRSGVKRVSGNDHSTISLSDSYSSFACLISSSVIYKNINE